MDASQNQNLNGQIAKNKKESYFWTFLSPLKFWAAYGYWFCLMYYTAFLGSGDLGSRIPFPEPLCPFFWGCSDTVYEFFFTIPAFFFLLIGCTAWGALKKKAMFLKCALFHIIVIILLTDFVNNLVDGIIWSGR